MNGWVDIRYINGQVDQLNEWLERLDGEVETIYDGWADGQNRLIFRYDLMDMQKECMNRWADGQSRCIDGCMDAAGEWIGRQSTDYT